MQQFDWKELNSKRQQRVINYMKDMQLDALILVASDNIRYVANIETPLAPETFYDQHAIVFTVDGNMHMVTTLFPEVTMMSYPWILSVEKIPAWVPASCQIDKWIGALQKILTRETLENGAVGIDMLPFDVYEGLKENMPNLKVSSVMKDLLTIRSIKVQEEIFLLKEAAAICDTAATKLLHTMDVGMSEYELVGILLGELGKGGAESITHYPALRSGERTLNSITPSDKKLCPGESVIFDFGIFGPGGYTCDMARTGFIGEPSKELSDCYIRLIDIQTEAIERMKPGVWVSEIDEFINRSLINQGYPASPYANGHGCGLRLMELPTIDAHENLVEDIQIKDGMVICLEPLTSCDEGAVKIEDVIHVTANGNKKLTNTPYWID